MSKRTATILLVVLLFAGPAWIWYGRAPAAATDATALPPAPAIGHPAPDFTLSTVDGRQVTLSGLRGKPVILNFWATWRPPCRAELPELQGADRRYAGQVEVIGINQGEPAPAVLAFALQMGLTFPIPLDGDARVSRLYAVRSLPTSYLIDAQGTIRQIQIGPLSEATLAQLLQTVGE